MYRPSTIPIEESNLAGIGSDEDKAARQAAARLEFNWEGAGAKPGIEIWRVENERSEDDTPDFGIKPWPKRKYGKFHRGDSYIVLVTTKDPEGELLEWDIYFWIGSQSSQDEYGVAAYKAVELDDLLGDAPIQHREVEGRESKEFVQCFPKGIHYLEGGHKSGFRQVSGEKDTYELQPHLYQVQKKQGEKVVRCFEVPLTCSSLNDGDAFLLDADEKVYTWFGSTVSGFEKSKSATVAHNIKESRLGECECILDVDDDNEEFWELLGGKGEIKPADEGIEDGAEPMLKKMYTISDASGMVKVKEVPMEKSALVSEDVCIVDLSKEVYIWVGKESTKREKDQAMVVVSHYLKSMGRIESTHVTRVLEGQERRCRAFSRAF